MNARAVALGLGLWWPGVAAAGWTPDIKLDHFGYRPADRKIALLTTSATGGVVEVRRAADGSLAYAVPSASLTGPFNDAGGDSGDTVITRADFTDLTAPGDYYLRVPAWGATSYVFSIGAGVYNNAAAALLKAFFAQRCGTGKPASAMGVWADPGACHVANDSACAHFGGEPGTNYGSLDLTGGWHDAGDHNKYIGGHAGYGGDDGGGIFGITAGFELNATAFNSDQTSLLPGESGNGVPDCLDEARWHAEWYRKMQRPDGSVLSLVHTNGFGGGGTPSGDLVTRYYYDATVDSTSIAGACFARLARLLQPYQPGWAATYEAAANAAWGWLPVVNTDTKLWLAAELYRLNPGGANAAPAQSYVDAYRNWGNGAGAQAWAEGGNLDSKSYGVHFLRAMSTYCQAPGATPSTVAGMKAQFGRLVDRSIAIKGNYFSDMEGWEYVWGSNRAKGNRGLWLVYAARLGATGTHTAAEAMEQAQNYLHYIFGLNAINMLYATNMAAIGGEHSAWRVYHGWFGHGSAFYGKPTSVYEPAYPYTPPLPWTDSAGVSDDVISATGPFPGIVPGGADAYYPEAGCWNAGAVPPGVGPTHAPVAGTVPRHRMYRDFSYCCQGVDATGTVYCPWQVSENHLPYQGAVTGLAAAFMAPDAAVALTKTGSGATANRWTELTYTLGVTNVGTQTAWTPGLWDTVPAGSQFVSATAGGVYDGTTVSWTRPALAAGATWGVSFTVTVTGAGPLLGPNIAAASFLDGGGQSRAATSPPATVEVVTGARLAARLEAVPTLSPEGAGFLVVLTVTNTGLADADGLDAGPLLQSGTGSAWQLAGPSAALPLAAPVPPGGTVVLTWTFAGSDLGTVVFSMTLSAIDAATSGPIAAGPFTSPAATVYEVPGCAVLFNGCEAFGNNGAWSGSEAVRSINTSLAAAITQGGASLKASVTSPSGWERLTYVLAGFSPNVWNGYATLDVDLYVDPGSPLWAGGSAWHQAGLLGETASKGEQQISSALVWLNTGMNRVSFPLDWPNTIGPADALTRIRVIFNLDQPLAGDVYLDRMTLTTTASGGGLLVSAVAAPRGAWPAPLAGEWFDVVLTASNPCTATVMSLLSDVSPVTGSGLVTVTGPPVPAGPVTLPPGASQVFTWTFSADGAGTVLFSLTAAGLGDFSLTVTAGTALPVTVPAPASLAASLDAVINPVNAGSTLFVTLTVSNTGGTDATAVTPGALLVSGGPGAAAVSAGPWPAGASLPPGGMVVFTWSATADAPSQATFSTTVTGVDAAYGTPPLAATPVPAVLGIGTSAYLDAAAFLIPVLASAGQTINVWLTVTNAGTVAAVLVVPALVNQSGASLTLTSSPGPGPFTIFPGPATVFQWSFTVDTPGILEFSLSVAGRDAVDGRPLFASRTVGGTAIGPAALSAGMSVSATSAMVGQTRRLTVTAVNTGTAAANLGDPNLMLRGTAVLGASSFIQAGPPASGTLLAGLASITWTWTIAAVSPGITNWSMTVVGTDVNSGATVSAFAGLFPLRFDTIGLAAVSLTLSAVSATVDDLVTMVLTVQNTGSLPLSGVRPSPVAFGGDGRVLAVAGPVPATATVAAGATVQFRWTWRAARAGTVTFAVSAADGSGLGTPALAAGPLAIREPGNSIADMIVYPNPFRFATAVGGTVKFRRMPGGATVRIYTIAGEEVAELTADGYGYAEWDGRNERGERVLPGVYVFHALAPDHKTKKTDKLQIAP